MLIRDDRLAIIEKAFHPKKVTPAAVEVVDTPPLAVGAHESREGNARLIATLREAQAIFLVVRAFASDLVPHPKVSIEPVRDLNDLRAELIVADLDVTAATRAGVSSLEVFGAAAERLVARAPASCIALLL
jgi:ribosome-binding ATPase YchF (GTP1/OBG family)